MVEGEVLLSPAMKVLNVEKTASCSAERGELETCVYSTNSGILWNRVDVEEKACSILKSRLYAVVVDGIGERGVVEGVCSIK